jgi:DNA polymerase (family 10)
MPLNEDIAAVFGTMADIMDIKGENPFRVLAFRKVGRTIGDLSQDVGQLVREGKLHDVPGIGEHSARIIEQYVKTGSSTEFEDLKHTIPAGLLPLLRVEGVGPKTVSLLWRERSITSAEDLAKAIAEGKLAGLKGIGDKKIEAMRKGLEAVARRAGRVGLLDAEAVAADLLRELRKLPQVRRAEHAGSLRRRRETIGDVDLLAAVADEADAPKVIEAFEHLAGVERTLGAGPTKASVVTASGLQVDLRVLPLDHWGAALMYFTGSKDHNVRVRSLAQKAGLTLNEWGLYREADYDKSARKTGEAPSVKPVAARSEEEIYGKLGLPFIAPELREDRGEVEAALAGKLPGLIELRDIRGDLHAHTTASDGNATIEEMALAAKELGYEYLAITDHSKSQTIANGLDARRLLSHAAQIRKANDRLTGITLLAGTEVDILADGHLDYEDAVLAELDVVIASPHVALKQDSAKATDRLLRAIEKRHVHVIGHPTGRMINQRDGLELDLDRIFRACAQSHTALEINAGWPRLDLSDVNARAAAEADVVLSINTDAHSAANLADMALGLGVARRAWLEPRHILNCRKLSALRQFLRAKR